MSQYNYLSTTASRVQMKLSGGIVTDENRYPLTLIKHAIHAARAWYLGEKLSKKFSIPQQYYQKIDCLKIECIEQECDGIKTGKTSLIVTIPELLGGVGDLAIKYAGDVKGMHEFTQIKGFNPNVADNSPFVPKATTPRYIHLGNELELFNLPTPNMEYFMVVGLFADPDNELIRKCDGTEKPYPVTGDDLKIIEDLVTKDYFDTLVRLRPDLSNDAAPK